MFICVFSPCFSLSLRCVSFTDPHMTQVLVLVIFLVVLYPVSLTPVSGLAPASFCLHWFTCSLSVLLNVGPKVSDLRSISPDAGIECCDFPLPAMGTSVFVEMSWRSGCSMWTFVISWVGRVRCPSLDATRLFSLLVHTSGLGFPGHMDSTHRLHSEFPYSLAWMASSCFPALFGISSLFLTTVICVHGGKERGCWSLHLPHPVLLPPSLFSLVRGTRGGCPGQGGCSVQGRLLWPREAAPCRDGGMVHAGDDALSKGGCSVQGGRFVQDRVLCLPLSRQFLNGALLPPEDTGDVRRDFWFSQHRGGYYCISGVETRVLWNILQFIGQPLKQELSGEGVKGHSWETCFIYMVSALVSSGV